MDISQFSVAELTAYIQEALRQAGIDVILSGGNCVSIWSDNAYRSDDIDLIPEGVVSRSRIKHIMTKLGFIEKNRYFIHPQHEQWVEFPNGPLGVGDEAPKSISRIYQSTGTLRLLSPTDCVKDRLTWWYHDNDQQGLNQAIAVCQCQQVDLDEIHRWSVNEGKGNEFTEIKELLLPNDSK